MYISAETKTSVLFGVFSPTRAAPPVAPVGLAVVDGTETQDSLTIRWDCPESNGREDTFFMVCHTTVDTSPQCSEVTPVSCEDPVVHTITGLDPVTSYMIDVSTHDGITDQDPDNDLLRISRTSGSTAEGGEYRGGGLVPGRGGGGEYQGREGGEYRGGG